MSSERNRLAPSSSYSPDPHRLLPHSPDAEKGVLSSCLLSPREVIGLCIEKGLRSECFSSPGNGVIFTELLAMWDGNEAIDFITLTQWLRDKGKLDQCGGAAYVTDLFTFLPTAANASFYIEIVIEKFVLREVIKNGTEYVCRAYEEQDEIWQFLDRYEAAVLGIRTLKRSTRPPLRTVVVNVVTKIQTAYDNRGGVTGLATGFRDLDSKIDGLHAEEMIVVAARPSHGKTALMLNIVDFIAVESRKPVAVFSLEMSTEQLVQRLICSHARVNYFRLRDGYLSERDFPAIQVAATRIADAPLYVEDRSGQSIQEIRAVARRLRSEKKIEAVFIDYLQLASSSTKRAQENRAIEVGEISTGCKNMARELGIPVVVLAQVDRSVDKQQRKPRLSDLRESGAIEQDADVVAFLTREEMYAQDEDELQRLEGMATLSIAKSRSGPLGEVPLTFIKEFTLFETRARESHEEPPEQRELIQ